MKKYFAAVLAVSALVVLSSAVFAACGMCGSDTASTEKTAVSAASEKVNNTICPVSGQAVNMKDPVTTEYKGKIYNFCCSDCIAPFKANPEKYIKK